MAPGPPSPSLLEQTRTNLKLTLSRSLTGIPSEQLCCESSVVRATSCPATNYSQICFFLGDYRNLTGEGIPFRKLGFDSLGSLFDSLPDTLVVRRLPTGGMMVGPLQPLQPAQQVIPITTSWMRFPTLYPSFRNYQFIDFRPPES